MTKHPHIAPPLLYPFSGIVGQEEVKKALLLNCICPSIGGVLLAGEKGTAKSTIARSLQGIFPDLSVVTLPLNATEDRVLGSIDIEVALKEGKAQFQPGLLSQAHQNILYIDEVNLLSESLINTILDAAASGRCTIEREGISHTFPSQFILIGSMNPEEGSLRPQILDRFGFYVEVKGEMNLRNRIEVIKNRMHFESNPVSFLASVEADQLALQEEIENARKAFHHIKVKDEVLTIIAEMCQKSFLAGHRGDLALCNGARAHAALQNNKQITIKDIEAVNDLALSHRIRSVQAPPPPPPEEQSSEDEQDKNEQPQNQENSSSEAPQLPEQSSTDQSEEKDNQSDKELEEELFDIGSLTLNTDLIERIKDKQYRSQGSGRRSKTRTHSLHGHYVKVKLPGKKKVNDLAFDATLRAAAPFQKIRPKNGTAIQIHQEDIRVKIREKRIGHTVLFLLDASGSMGINKRMTEAKAAVFELLKESYKKRDTVGLMKFNNTDAELVLQPTRSLDLAYKSLKVIKTGGKTPLEKGIEDSTELMRAMRRKDSEILPVVVILSDGKANQSAKGKSGLEAALQAAQKAANEQIRFIVVDTETGFIRLGLAKKLANALKAEYYLLDELKNIQKIINER